MIKNLIFDLGGVLYEINTTHTEMAFQALLNRYRRQTYSPFTASKSALLFETGELTTEEFRQSLRSEFLMQAASDAEIDAAWNALLIGLFPDRINWLKSLKPRFRLALLSNTNRLHYDYLIEECAPLFAEITHPFFSFQIGLRKPEREIFEYALAETGFLPQETLFIEDTAVHVQKARAVGLHALHLTNPATLPEQLNEFITRVG